VTIALGSTLASVIVSRDVPLVEGVVALGLLVGLQFVITWLSVRMPAVRRLVNAEPAFPMDKGKFQDAAMMRELVSESELLMAIRSKGFGSVEDIEAVVLETDGSFSVIERSKAGSRRRLRRSLNEQVPQFKIVGDNGIEQWMSGESIFNFSSQRTKPPFRNRGLRRIARDPLFGKASGSAIA
jgi:uncharacterized membrane protein YcaP (DUF421 family)